MTQKPYSRRQFLQQTTALAILSGGIGSESMYSQTPATNIIPTTDTTLKFNSSGAPRPFAGNTVICHLPVQCAMRDAMLAFHQELAAAPFRRKLGLTSTESYHMTVFSGANDLRRDLTGWPSYVPPEAPIEQCSRLVGERMDKARLAGKLPLRVRVDQTATVGYPVAATLRLVPADDAEDRNIRSIRDQLAEVYGFRQKDHDTYGLHMTMSYQIAPFTAAEQTAYRAMLKKHTAAILAAQPVLELGMPEFCTFADMFRFDPQTLIRVS